MQGINQQPFGNFALAFPVLGQEISCLGKGFQTPDKAALSHPNSGILSALKHLWCCIWYSPLLFRYPQIIPLQIQLFQIWVRQELCLFHPKPLNERFFLESEASPPTRVLHIQRFSCWLRFLTLSMRKNKDWNKFSHVPKAAGAAAGPALQPSHIRVRNQSLEKLAQD